METEAVRTESQRAQPRVDYAAEVHILRPGGRTPIRARSLNLSPTGVFLEAEHRATNDCPVGTRLLCDIPLPGGRRYLKGRVARMQSMPSAATGLGICFENLEAADQAILHTLVQNGSDHSRLVKVRFEGMPEALRSRAVVTKDGLRLQTSLPFLRLDSAVDVSFIAGDSRVETHGTLERVHLEPEPGDGIPRLAVDVALPESAAPLANEFLADSTPRTGEFGPEETTARSAVPEAMAASVGQPESPYNPSPSAPTLILHKGVAPTMPLEMPTAPATAVAAANTPLPLHTPSRTPRRRQQPTRIRERRPAPTPQTPTPMRTGDPSDSREVLQASIEDPIDLEPTVSVTRPRVVRRASNPWWWTWGWPVLGAILVAALIYDRVMVSQRIDARLTSQVAVLEDTRKNLDETRSLARQAKGAAEATQAATLGLKGVIHREISAAFEKQGRPGTPAKHGSGTAESASAPAAATAIVADEPVGPSLRVSGATATASVAITGSTDGMIQYSLKDPTGVVVKLPKAKSLLPVGHYRVREGGFGSVWVDRKPEGLAIRFIYDSSRPRQEMLEVIEAGPDPEAPAGSPEAAGSVRVRLRRAP
ncbi:MAG: PilZ domain-containing protein [Deltaproteobacteria bacterium]|nr:PilZ domain-containing protein [Deltaproteobacteria bacterium]